MPFEVRHHGGVLSREQESLLEEVLATALTVRASADTMCYANLRFFAGTLLAALTPLALTGFTGFSAACWLAVFELLEAVPTPPFCARLLRNASIKSITLVGFL